MTRIKIGIIEDESLVRLSLERYFIMTDNIDCLISTNSIEEFLVHLNPSNLPEVVLCDINLPGMDGIKGLKLIKNKYPQIEVAMLTCYEDKNEVLESIGAGATGYLLKTEPIEDIQKAIIHIKNNGSYMSPLIARKILSHLSSNNYQSSSSTLTCREMEIVKKISEGLSNKMVAHELFVSLNTVKFHLRNIYSKLQINSKTELLRKALRNEI
jgi:DNA-binding NarL/FixJ family response regulator